MEGRARMAVMAGVAVVVAAIGISAAVVLSRDGSGTAEPPRDADGASVGASGSPSPGPARFTTVVDNPYFPLRTGMRWEYRSQTEDGETERTRVEVLAETRLVKGVTCVVVHDTVSVDGAIIEDTFDWYAQDAEGNVWYFGEDTKEFENGKVVSTKGSWEAGVDGAEEGIIMKAQPKVGDTYRQEYYRGEAEDMGEVLALDARATVPYGSFDNLVQTKDTTPLEPDVVEHKYYARGVGVVLVVSGGTGRDELVEMTGR
jgi:hypothetical protein